MKRIASPLLLILLAVGLLIPSGLSAFAQTTSMAFTTPASATSDKGWPRTFTAGATSFSVYQPQVDGWKAARHGATAMGQLPLIRWF